MVGRVLPLSASLALLLAAAPVQAQLTEVPEAHRFEIIPVAGYVWGGSYETDVSSAFPAGHLRVSPSFAWGGIISFLAHGGSAVELTYLRQDSDIKFDPAAGSAETPLGSFAMNYIQIGGRQEFGVGGNSGVRPFIGASLGINILDPGNPNIGSDTRFSWSIGGGLVKMLKNNRVGLRSDIKLWITPVPSGDYGTWCDFYGCFVAEGTAWVTQGQWSGGLVFAF